MHCSNVSYGHNLNASLNYSLEHGSSGLVEASNLDPDGSDAQASQLLPHVKTSHLARNIGPLLGVEEAMVSWGIVPYLSTICIPVMDIMVTLSKCNKRQFSYLDHNLVLFLCILTNTIGKSLKAIPLNS